MDNRKGQFEEITNEIYKEQIEKTNPMVFKIGDIIKVRGSKMRVHKIYKNKITFKLLPQ